MIVDNIHLLSDSEFVQQFFKQVIEHLIQRKYVPNLDDGEDEEEE